MQGSLTEPDRSAPLVDDIDDSESLHVLNSSLGNGACNSKVVACCRGNDTYGITGIPFTVGGRGVVQRAGLVASTKTLTQVRATRMRNTLVLLWCMFECS